MTYITTGEPIGRTWQNNLSIGRRLDIDRTKGLGIILVVIGHLVEYNTDPAPLWYVALSKTIYVFHMPLFMYLSGFVYFANAGPAKASANYMHYFLSRFNRLVVPFVALGALIVFGKYAAGHITHLHEAVGSPLSGLWAMISNAPTNPTLSIWYILVLFVYCCLTPFIYRVLGRRIDFLFIFSVILYFIPFADQFYLARIGRFYVYFCFGGLVAANFWQVQSILEKFWVMACIVFLALMAATFPYAFGLVDHIPSPLIYLLCGLSSCPVINGLMRRSPWNASRVLLELGRCSMAIYLLNTILIGVAKAVYRMVLPIDGAWFFLLFWVLLIAGLIGPLLIKRFVDKVPTFAPLARYMT